MNSTSIKVLVIGQTPPPYYGQAMMIQRLVNAKFINSDLEILHIRLAFSDEVKKIGKISLGKIFHLFNIIYKVYKLRFLKGDMILYYPPSGPNITPIIRDLVLLFFIRPIFTKKIYHFRAAGLSDYLKTKSKLFQSICKTIYGKPDIGIQLSFLNPEDANYLQAKKTLCIPNGLEDDAIPYLPIQRPTTNESTINILFVGVLREDKGLTCLINALNIVRQKGVENFTLTVMGEFSSVEYKKTIEHKIFSYRMNNFIVFVGSQTKKSKWDYFVKAHFLCFPTFFNSESFGNVLVEAMMFQLPVIATQWRGIPDIVSKETGFLIPVKNEINLADKIFLLIHDSTLRSKLGENARKRFLENYTLEKHLSKMEDMFTSLRKK